MTGDEHRADDLTNYKVVRSGDIVINRMRAFQGAVGLAPSEGLVSPDYLVLRLDPSLNPRFFHHLFRSRWFVSEMTSRLRGIGSVGQGNVRTPRINVDDLGEISIAVPSATDQRRIAAFLDGETERIDQLIATKDRMIEVVHQRFEAMVYSMVSKGCVPSATRSSGHSWVGEIPESWGMAPVGAFFDCQLGKMLNAEAASGPEQYPYLRNTNIQWDHIDMEDLASMHFDAQDRARCDLRVGDVLVCEGGEVGRSAVWSGELEDCYYQKAVHRLRQLKPGTANPRFLMYCFRAAAKMNVFAVQGNLSTIVHLTGEQLRMQRFPWPPVEVQDRLVGVLDRQRDWTAELTTRLGDQIDLLAERRHSLITAAVTGEMRIP